MTRLRPWTVRVITSNYFIIFAGEEGGRGVDRFNGHDRVKTNRRWMIDGPRVTEIAESVTAYTGGSGSGYSFF